MDPRIPPIAEELLARRVPGKNISEISHEYLEAAREEATLLLEIIDGLRPPDIMVLANRQIERIAAWAKNERTSEIIEMLTAEENWITTSEQYEHLIPGLRWTVELLRNRLA